ncbi:MAG: response regulator [Chloroflexota bacterium]|nr:response regulator [Chloroflexota bacterium]
MTKRNKRKTILVIEDDTNVQTFASRVLELEGYSVLQAENADEGLQLVRENECALVLLDLRMTGRDGWAVLEEMKAEPELRAIPVVVFTASVAAPQQDKAFEMGAADYLTKPLSVAKLREAVARIVG